PYGEAIYIDELMIYADQVPTEVDAHGNPMIGPVVAGALPPNEPYNPAPANGAIDRSINTDITWNGGDPEGDPVTYDVYFGTSSTPALVSSAKFNAGESTGSPASLFERK
ncbi:hypothetical protein ACFL1E_07965, partial [Candidatus Omnitrophota bacterium]